MIFILSFLNCIFNIIFENLIKNVEIEEEHLSFELEAVKHELEVIFQQRDEKMLLLQSEISSLQAQIASLQEDIFGSWFFPSNEAPATSRQQQNNCRTY